MGIDNKTVTTERLERCTIQIVKTDGELSALPPEPEVGPGFLVEWVADFEFAIDFKGNRDSPVSFGQYQFASMESGGRHRVAIIAGRPGYRRRLVYDIQTFAGVLDPALIIDPNRRRSSGIS